MCPGSGWREYLAQTIARMIQQTDPDVIYMDGVGLSYDTCEDTAHDHPYKDGWHVAVGNLLSGTMWASEMSTRRRMVGEAAGPHRIVNAIALDSALDGAITAHAAARS